MRRAAVTLATLLAVAPAVALDYEHAFPTERDAGAERLLDIWRYQSSELASPRPQRVEIVAFEVRTFEPIRGVSAIAYVRFRPLDEAGSAEGWNAKVCAGQTLTATGVQMFFRYDVSFGRWVPGRSIGSSLCSTDPAIGAADLEEALTMRPYPTPPKISAKDIRTPPPGSPERREIMDLLRTQYGREASKIVFEVRALKIAADFAWVSTMPRYANGKIVGCIEGDDLTSDFWLKKKDGKWTIVRGAVCSGDPVSVLGEEIGAPPELVGATSWPL